MSVLSTVGEPLLLHRLVTKRDVQGAVVALLERVGLKAEDRFRYPHEFSGGQRQRIGIAARAGVAPEADRRRRAGLLARPSRSRRRS